MAPANPAVSILIIGDEILRGEIHDTNSQFLAEQLTARGIDVVRITVLPDEIEAIGEAVNRARSAGCRYVICSGGIGPTPDDMTRQAVAIAFDRELVLQQTIVRRYEELSGLPLNEAQLGMCRLPEGAEPILADTIGAPGFKLDGVYVLPGVPSILRDMWTHIEDDFHGQPDHVESFVALQRESDFAALMAQHQSANPELSIGSYPRRLGERWEVLIRVRGRNRELVQQVARQFMTDMGGKPQLD